MPSRTIPKLLPRVDWLVIVAPHTPETERLIGREELALLRAHARLVNLGRGALVDEPALIEALRSGRLAGAALDVFENEPLPATSPLWTMENVIITPHVAGFGPQTEERRLGVVLDNVRRFVAGEPLANVADKARWY